MRNRGPVALALALVLGFAIAAGFASPVNAAKSWSIKAAPPALTVGVATDVTLTVTPGDRHIRCLTVSVPSGFTVLRVSVASAPGATWTASNTGSGPTLATFATNNANDELEKADARFVIRVIATRSPLPAWTSAAYGNFPPCAQSLGHPRAPLPPFRISPTPASPPPPPGSTPTLRLTPTIVPPGATTRPTDTVMPSAAPQPSPSDSTAGVIGPGGSGGATAGGGDGTPIDVRALPAGGSVQVDVSAIGAIGMFAWVVPGLFLSLPGLLLVLIVLAQAGFASAFVPVIRRVLGVGGRRPARNRPISPG